MATQARLLEAANPATLLYTNQDCVTAGLQNTGIEGPAHLHSDQHAETPAAETQAAKATFSAAVDLSMPAGDDRLASSEAPSLEDSISDAALPPDQDDGASALLQAMISGYVE